MNVTTVLRVFVMCSPSVPSILAESLRKLVCSIESSFRLDSLTAVQKLHFIPCLYSSLKLLLFMHREKSITQLPMVSSLPVSMFIILLLQTVIYQPRALYMSVIVSSLSVNGRKQRSQVAKKIITAPICSSQVYVLIYLLVNEHFILRHILLLN